MADNPDNEVRISSRKHPNAYLKAILGRLNEGHDEVVLSGVGGATDNLEQTLGKLMIEQCREDGVYNIPDDLAIGDVEHFTKGYDREDGSTKTENGVRVTVAS